MFIKQLNLHMLFFSIYIIQNLSLQIERKTKFKISARNKPGVSRESQLSFKNVQILLCIPQGFARISAFFCEN